MRRVLACTMLIVRVPGSRETSSLLVQVPYMLTVSWMKVPPLSYHFEMSIGEAEELARRAIYHAAFRDGESGGCVSVYHVGPKRDFEDNGSMERVTLSLNLSCRSIVFCWKDCSPSMVFLDGRVCAAHPGVLRTKISVTSRDLRGDHRSSACWTRRGPACELRR